MFSLFSNNLRFSDCVGRYLAKAEADVSLSPKSLGKYREVAKRIIDLIGDINIKNLDLMVITDLKTKLNNLNLSPSRKNHFLIVIKNTLKYLKEVEKVNALNSDLIKKFKEIQKDVEYLTQEESEKLINSIKEDRITNLRLKTIIKCFLSTAARLSELAQLNKEDIDFNTGVVSVRGKGSKINKIIFSKKSLEYIQKYIDRRDDKCSALFVTHQTKNPCRLQINCIERAIRNLGWKVLNRRVYPHLFRKTSASLLYFSGVNPSIIQRYLSHSSFSTTQKHYLRGAKFEEVVEAHNKHITF